MKILVVYLDLRPCTPCHSQNCKITFMAKPLSQMKLNTCFPLSMSHSKMNPWQLKYDCFSLQILSFPNILN